MILNALKIIFYFLLFYLICTGVVFILSVITGLDKYIDIMGIWWIISAISMAMLLTVVFICKKTEGECKGAHCNYYKFNYQLLRQVKAKVRCWIYPRFLKILQILNRIEVSPQVPQAKKATDKHALHNDNLTEGI